MSDIDVMYNNDYFMCAVSWDRGGQYSVTACINDKQCPSSCKYKDGYDWKGVSGGYKAMGSIFVKPGCQLYMWSDPDYHGHS